MGAYGAEKVDISDTFGAAFIGVLGMMGLYGITTAQTYIYYIFYPEDGFGLKSLVSFIWILDTAHVALSCHTLYYYLVTNYSDPTYLSSAVWSLWISVLFNCFIGCITQGFFTVKLYFLLSPRTRNWLVPIIAITVIGHLAFGIETVIIGLTVRDFAQFHRHLLISALPFAVFSVISDVLIAGCLCVVLQKSKAYFMTTNKWVNQLILFAINRCLLTAGAAVTEVILYAVFPDSLWYMALDFVIGKLYANSLLATLNTRFSMRARANDEIKSPETTDQERTPPALRLASGVQNNGASMFSTVIQVEEEEEDIMDDGDSEEERRKSRTKLYVEQYELEAR